MQTLSKTQDAFIERVLSILNAGGENEREYLFLASHRFAKDEDYGPLMQELYSIQEVKEEITYSDLQGILMAMAFKFVA